MPALYHDAPRELSRRASERARPQKKPEQYFLYCEDFFEDVSRSEALLGSSQPSVSKASKYFGQLFETQPGSRMRTPGTRRPTSEKAIAMRWSS